MIIYDYDGATKELKGQREARQDPLNPTEYLIPRFATTIEPPPEQSGYARCFIGDGWQYIEDNRGEVVYDISDASRHIVTALGAISEEYTTLVPCEYPLWDGTQWIINTAEQDAELAAQAKITAKLNDIAENLPSWSAIADEYATLITDAQAAKEASDVKALATVVIRLLRRSKKAERILYWLAKNSAM